MNDITIRRAAPQDADEVAEIHLRSRAVAMPWLPVVHTNEETYAWIREIVLPNEEVWVAEHEGAIAGFMAIAPGWLEQLYLAPERQGAGLGRRMLDLAKERQPGGLKLWAFAANVRARHFYEAAGFTLIEEGDGSGNEEGTPDVLYQWLP